MKPFWLFGGDIYYPSGGMEDFAGSFDSLDEAKAAPIPGEPDFRWAHIYHDGAIVAILRDEEHGWESP